MAIGVWQVAAVAVVIILLFGGKRLASLGKGLGDGIRNFRKGVSNVDEVAGELNQVDSKAGG